MYRVIFEDSASRTTRWYYDIERLLGLCICVTIFDSSFFSRRKRGTRGEQFVLGRRTCKRLSSSRHRTYFSPFNLFLTRLLLRLFRTLNFKYDKELILLMNLGYLWSLQKVSEDNKFLDITLSPVLVSLCSKVSFLKFPFIKFPLNPSLATTTNCHSTFSSQPISEDFVSRSIKL